MPGSDRRSRRLKQAVALDVISDFASINPADGDLLIYDATDGRYENGKGLTGNYTLTGALNVDDITIGDDLIVGDALTVGGNAGIDGDLAVIGAATLNGNTSVAGTLGVTGAVTLSDALTVAGALSGAGFSFASNGQIDGNLTVDGSITAGSLTLADLTLTGNFVANTAVIASTVEGDIGVFDTSLSAPSISAENIAAANDLSVGDDVRFGGDLFITGPDGAIRWGSADGTLLNGLIQFDTSEGELTLSDGTVSFAILDATITNLSAQTGALTLPTGTDAQQPGTPAAGMIRWNTDGAAVEVWDGSAWGPVVATPALVGLTDVNITTGVGVDGYSVTWDNAAGEFVLTDVSGGGGGGLANVVDDTTPQLGGALDVNGNSIVSVSNGDITLAPNGTGNVLLGNYEFDVDQTVGAGQDNYVLTYDNSTGLISLEAAAGGGGSLTNTVDDGSAAELRFSGTQTLETYAGGVYVYDTSGDDPAVTLRTQAGTTIGLLQSFNNTLYLYNTVASATSIWYGTDSGSALTTMLQLNPNGAAQLYFDGTKTFETTASGAAITDVSGNSPSLNFLTTGGSGLGNVQVSGTTMYMYNFQSGGHVLLYGNSGGLSTIFEGDPAGGVAFNGGTVSQPTITGSRGGNAALASLLTALDTMGLIINSSTA